MRRRWDQKTSLQFHPVLPQEARTSTSIYQNRLRAVLTRQHSAASRVDKRAAARLTQAAEAELSLFSDPGSTHQLYFTAGRVCLTFCRRA